MSRFEFLSLLIALVSAAVAAAALVRTRRTESRLIELQETQAKLAALQHTILAAEQEVNRRADLRAELVRSGPNEHHFVFSNVGASPAKNVSFAFYNLGPRKSPVVLPEQFNSIFPISEFLPNQSHRLRAILTLDTPSTFEGELTWFDSDGSTRKRKCPFVL